MINAGSNSSTISYGAYRNRYKQTAVTAGVTETTIYVGGILEKVTRSGVTEYRHLIEGGNGTAAIYVRRSSGSPATETYFVHRDQLGSPELVTNGAGAVVVRLSFGAYGERRDSDWDGAVSSADMTAIGNTTRRGFTGHEHLDSVNLIHMNGRVYDPVIGRFLSVDALLDVGSSQSPNSYSYVRNMPLSATDPSGYFSCTFSHVNYGPDDVRTTLVCSWGEPNPYYYCFDCPYEGMIFDDSWFANITISGLSDVSQYLPPERRQRLGGADGQGQPQTQKEQQCVRQPDNRSFGAKAADFAVGFGDAFLIPIIVRNLAGIEGTTDYDSAAYGAGKITGVIEGLVPMALQGAAAYSAAAAARGAPSMLNANRYFRIGPGVGWGGTNVPRISSPFLPGNGHFSLTSRLPLIPPLGALYSAGGGGCPGGN